MVTTIQVQETTKQVLDNLKNKEREKSYDVIIRHLLKEHVEVSDMFGFTKKKPLKFSRKDELKFNEI